MLATLVLLVQTNVLETAVVALRPATLSFITVNGSQQETVWLPDGKIRPVSSRETYPSIFGWSPYCCG